MLNREMVSKNFNRTAAALGICMVVWALTQMYSTIVLMHIISQLRPGADLSRVTLPTFILEPRSMLERITKYAAARLRISESFD